MAVDLAEEFVHCWRGVTVGFDENVPRVPKTCFRNTDLVQYHRRYQSQFSNYVT